MNPTYIVTLLDGGVLPGRQRIELEVRLACELERRLGEAEEVVAAFRAALLANDVQADAERWQTAFTHAVQAVRDAGQAHSVDFHVALIGDADRRGVL